MTSHSNLTGIFNEDAEAAFSEFADYLEWDFDRDTAKEVFAAFKKLNLPLPLTKKEFLKGSEGAVIFLNRYGIVIRLESKEDLPGNWEEKGVPETPWILQPIASIDVGEAILTICPGCHVGKDGRALDDMKKRLELEKIKFWDQHSWNMGTMPLKIPQFPEGIPVVIDRGAVEELKENVRPVRAALKEQMARETKAAAKAQKALYAPLRKAFDEAWPEPARMNRFWDLCRQYVGEKKLVAGWNEASGDGKTSRAALFAKNYEARLKAAEDKISPPAAPAVPR